MTMEVKPLCSLWGESRTTPKNSIWLKSALKELDEKTDAMVKLINGEADSFAQRVDMYYKRRPELIGLMQDFRGAYRSLASKYDILRGRVRLLELSANNNSSQQQSKQQTEESVGSSNNNEQTEKVAKAENEEDTISMISLESMFETPFGQQLVPTQERKNSVNKVVQRLTRGKLSELNSESSSDSEVEDPEEPQEKIITPLISEHESSEVTSICSTSSCSDPDNEAMESRIKVMENVITNLEKDNAKLSRLLNLKNHQLRQFREEANKLKKERSYWKEESTQLNRKRSQLQKQSDMFRSEYSKIWHAHDASVQQTKYLQEKLGILERESESLQKGNIVMSLVLKNVIDSKVKLEKIFMNNKKILVQEQETTERLHKEIEMLWEENLEKDTEIVILTVENEAKGYKLYQLHEENREQASQLLLRSEEKIQAIRHLSMAMESTRMENQRLEETLRSQKNGSSKAISHSKSLNNHDNNINQLWRAFYCGG